ncbi:MAG TPA: DUF6714 family protein [Bryobacteraceae bacterium]|nr:DUF6714 family protein [Bryobacteraceae bacterium]
MRKEEVIEQIRAAFGSNPYPGDAFLQGSFDGCEPADEVGAFIGKTDWSRLESKMLDEHYGALSFFSECAFRFFLPAYLIADVREELLSADPLFHLSHGFANVSVEVPLGSQTFRRDSSGETLLNPKRYGAMTIGDHARYRLSVFTREEATAIVTYMTYKRERDVTGLDRPRIDAALAQFWSDRAANAPSHQTLAAHLQEEERFMKALQDRAREQQ